MKCSGPQSGGRPWPGAKDLPGLQHARRGPRPSCGGPGLRRGPCEGHRQGHLSNAAYSIDAGVKGYKTPDNYPVESFIDRDRSNFVIRLIPAPPRQ
ncbi:MAG TPA: hypothetical protein VKX45_25265 [Bryobacteraceae bacterium]|nr:hypothetical protein [Bryobacteraceae bacterium]